jgi:hypothetical protein
LALELFQQLRLQRTSANNQAATMRLQNRGVEQKEVAHAQPLGRGRKKALPSAMRS